LKQRYSTHSFTGGLLMGATIALILAFIVAGMLDYFGPEYLDIISRFVAIPAAMLGALAAWNISRLQIRHHTQRDLAAWKAVLPLALSDLSRVAQNGILIAAKRHSSPPSNQAELDSLLSLQSTTLEVFQNCIKSSDPVAEKWLSILIAHYQVYKSRSDAMLGTRYVVLSGQNVRLHPEQQDSILSWAVLHALTAHHFNFSRNPSASISTFLDTSKIVSAIHLTSVGMAQNVDLQPALETKIARYGNGHVDKFLLVEE
jgi:hypothetical protein